MEPQKKVNEAFPNQDFGFIEDEYWKPVIVHGVTMHNYIVSNYGNVIGPQNRKLKWTRRSKINMYPRVGICFDPIRYTEKFGHTYRLLTSKNKPNCKVSKLDADVHILVANAFLPLDENIPEELKEYIEIDGQPKQLWSLLPDHTKLWIRSLLYVDHIDNDKSNPHVSNLAFVSPRGNNPSVKKQRIEGGS